MSNADPFKPKINGNLAGQNFTKPQNEELFQSSLNQK